jgi:hypothetical protein
VGKLQENQQRLNKAVSQGLLTLGEPIKETIQWHLKAHGIFLDNNHELDVHTLYEQLGEIVGNIADMIMDEIYDNLLDSSQNISLQINPNDPVVNRIEQLLAINTTPGSPSR